MLSLDTDIYYKEPISIGNSINLHVIQTNKFKTAVYCLLIRRPLNREESTKNALLPDVLKQGCRRYPSILKMNGRTEELFGSIFDCQTVKKGEEQILQLYFEGIPHNGNMLKGIEFLYDAALNPYTEASGVKPVFVDNAKKSVSNVIKGRINNKAEYARINCLAHMCKDEPFAVHADGYTEDLTDITPQSLYKHYMNILKTSPIELISAGNLGDTELAAAAGGLNIPNREPEQIPFAKCMPARLEVKRVAKDFNSAQGKICMGLRCDISPVSREFFGLLMMNEILGGGPNSKLFTKIREKENLCYYINSTLYRFKSIILIQSGVASGHFGRITELAGQEIEEIRQECITNDEWKSARKSLISKFRSSQEHFSSILDFYAAQHLLNDKHSLTDIIREVETVTVGETAEAARRVRLDTVFEVK